MIDQAIIAIGGAATVWLSQDPRPRVARFACIVGVLVQPAWFYATWRAGQWGIFALCFVYLLAWFRGVWHFWIRPPRGVVRRSRALEALADDCESAGAIHILDEEELERVRAFARSGYHPQFSKGGENG